MSLKTESYQLNLASQLLKIDLKPSHELVILANRIDWDMLEHKLKPFFQKTGRKAKRTRLMAGLLFLKHMHNLSDRQVVAMIHENVYFRHFCGLNWHIGEWNSESVIDSSTLTKFRRRLGKAGLKVIEDLIKAQLFAEKRISKKTALVDSTAQEKHIAHPTNASLLARGMQHLVKTINKLKVLGLKIKVRSHKRLARKELLKINKLGRGRKERVVQALKNLTKYASSVRKAAAKAAQSATEQATGIAKVTADKLQGLLKQQITLFDKAIHQALAWLNQEKISSKEKILSLHEPHTTVIAKGKRRNRYEFGAKVSLSADRNHYIVGHQEYAENIADVKSLDLALKDWQNTFGDLPDELGTDRGYYTKRPTELTSRIKHLAIQNKGKNPHPCHDKAFFKRLQRKRNILEAVIGHLKTDHRMNRCRYKGQVGDTMNVGLAVTAWNLRKWAREVRKEMKISA